MKLAVNKKQFLGSWSLAERSTSAGGTVSILSSILIKASAESVILQATDIKTSVICRAAGVTVLEPGEAVFPIKMVSDLFKKAPGEEFTLDVDGGKVVLKAGRSKYNFSTYPVSEFPALPSSDEADVFCSIPAGELAKVLDEGTLAASAGEEFPLYLSSANLQIISSRLNIVSTDTRRLALSAAPVLDGKEGESALLPMKGIKELQRILGSLTPETEVKVLFDGAQFYFKTETLEFTVRRVESKFPPYEKILPKHSTLDVLTDRGELISALEQITRSIQKAVISMITTVGFISTHQSTPLNIGHGRRARVRKIVDSDQGRGEREHVVLRLLQNITTFFDGAVTKHQGQILPTTECFSRCTAEQWGQRN